MAARNDLHYSSQRRQCLRGDAYRRRTESSFAIALRHWLSRRRNREAFNENGARDLVYWSDRCGEPFYGELLGLNHITNEKDWREFAVDRHREERGHLESCYDGSRCFRVLVAFGAAHTVRFRVQHGVLCLLHLQLRTSSARC